MMGSWRHRPLSVPVRVEWNDHACGLEVEDCSECRRRLKAWENRLFEELRRDYDEESELVSDRPET